MLHNILFIVIFSWLLSRITPMRVRNQITPYVFAYYLVANSLMPFAPSGLKFVIPLTCYLATAFLINGFRTKNCRQSFAVKAFIAFWAYLTMSMLLGAHGLHFVTMYIAVWLESVAIGYYVAVWAKENPMGWNRLLKVSTLAFSLTLLTYLRKGSFAVTALDAGNRMNVLASENEWANPNWIGLQIAGLLPIAILCLFKGFKGGGTWIVRSISILVSVGLLVLLVRTGARNSVLAIFPIVLYCLFSHSALQKTKKVIVFSVLSVAFLILLIKTTGSFKDLAVFREAKDGDVTSGRFDHFINMFYNSSELQIIFGHGAYWDDWGHGRYVLGNGHSALVQIAYQSGMVGTCFFVVFVFALLVRNLKRSERRQDGYVVLLLFGVWFLTGVAESQGIIRGGFTKILLGLALGFSTTLPRKYSCQGSRSFLGYARF